ncbi:MAG: NERD domain-containing protein [Oscillatoria sp. PMC 1051.18]|nr:NERD domain-containing protein [Oscillatoria sp. PMC 1050.18]MEC5031319.1 NERD domain-containing protein [Oscillatoria sp. PMC 1051.18]
MAKIYPETLTPDVKSPAEKLLYQAFAAQLPDNYTVLHQVSWQYRHPHSHPQDGETDFAIIEPHLGMLILEVKGGEIRYNSTLNQWYSNQYKIKDPFWQARNSKHHLIKLLKEQSFWQKRWISIGHAVAFPDVIVSQRLLPDAPREIILDRSNLDNLTTWIQDVLIYYRRQDKNKQICPPLSIQRLVNILKPSIYLQPTLGTIVQQQKQELIKLSEQQFRLLNYLGRHRRAAISGCAGSGKTLLAMEKVRRLREQEFTVLLTCYNKGLANFLRRSLGNQKNLHIYNFHALCKKLVSQAKLTAKIGQIDDKNVLFNEIYPSLLAEAAKKINWLVDAIVVDEGQDFRNEWWTGLKNLLSDDENGIFYIFYDDNQNLYNQKNWQLPLEVAPFVLTENWRNTRKIHDHVLQYYRGENPLTALGCEGRNIEFYHYPSNDNQALKKQLSRLLYRLVCDEDVAPDEIAILTTTRKQSLQNQLVGQFRIKADPAPNCQEILCNTIYYFKGLESPVVILVETQLQKVSQLRNLLYVGASRAQNHLIILQPDEEF